MGHRPKGRIMLNAFRSSTSTYSTLRLLQWLWNILRHHRLQTGLNTLLGCSTVLLDFMFIAATKWTIDIATYKAPGSLSIAAALLIGILLSQLCIHFASRWVKAILGVKAQNHMQRFYFDRLLHSEWKDRNRRHSGDLLNRLERDVTDVVNAVTETAPSIIAVCIRLVGAFLFLYSMDASLACLTIAIIPLFMVLSKVYMKRMRKLTREIRNTDSRIQSILQETIQHQMVVQTLEQQSVMVQRLDNIQQDLRNQIKTRTRFSSVSYAYDKGGRHILQDFTYDFPPGSHTAVIGETGAGKTTLIRLMLSLIHPTAGKIILYDNHGRQSECHAGTRSNFTYVPQGNTLFSGTIRENLLLGNPYATDEEMQTALIHACADFVFQLPEGLDSRCGEQGTGLSEGQSQRIAIARALLRPSGILLFDEATSSLDTATEKRLWQNICNHYGNKTLIFVTHRMNIITSETRVLKLSK